MELGLTDELTGVADLRHQVRHLRWFKSSFRRDAALIAEHHGVVLKIDDRRLTEVFLNWIEAFNRQKSYAALDRRDFTLFAAGLLLREFLRVRPVTEADPRPTGAAVGDAWSSSIVRFWPEGFLYTNYCLSVLSAVVQQEFGETLSLAKCADDLRLWWSYRENVREDPSMAIAFFDKFVGEEPNWRVPDSAESRAAMRRATKKLFAGQGLLGH
ncbi:hypothetical protein SAMN05519104_2615 [Rhizobiales bacterium GAS188]|nr:hypothetical protein SAMN05519104_2615 [Rhizobiales bacterium GAS188]